MGSKIEKIGQKFGRLTVLEFKARNKQYDSLWLCRCECGNEKVIAGGKLFSGHTKSCGCLQKERTSEAKVKHGLYFNDSGKRAKLYRVWIGIKERCTNPNNKKYSDYGGRGISISNEWIDYINFHNWAIGNGYCEGLTIERIDVNGNYEPNNCKWIPQSEQSKNRRDCHRIEFNGSIRLLTDVCSELGINNKAVAQRLRRGWDVQKALTTKF